MTANTAHAATSPPAHPAASPQPFDATATRPRRVAVIGAGPAGLMAAEVISRAGAAVSVQVFDGMPSAGRKFLLAGRGGLNLTHSEDAAYFVNRYGERRPQLEAMLAEFGPQQLRDWAAGLGIETFVGSSGLVFPKDMKAAPLLRAWLQRLRAAGVGFSMRHRWQGWTDAGALRFATPAGEAALEADAVVLALGGASWARLGSDGAWVPLLLERGVAVAKLQPSNCGFDIAPTRVGAASETAVESRRAFLKEIIGQAEPQTGWTDHFKTRFAGQPFKSVGLRFTDSEGHTFSRKGEFVATATGIEGSLVYAASSLLRNEIARHGSATLMLDLLPHLSPEQVLVEVRHPRGSRSLSSHLKSRLSLDGIKAAALHEILSKDDINDPIKLAHAIKGLPLRLTAARPIDEAISSAGGVLLEGLSSGLQVLPTPQADLPQPLFCAGEMLDWEAPTGGYLLTACFSSGYAAGQGLARHLGVVQA